MQCTSPSLSICYRRKKESYKHRCTLTCASSLHSLHFFTTPSRFCLFLPPSATLHPSLDNKIPVAAPIPELAPEMHNRMTGFTISPKYLDLNSPNLPVSNYVWTVLGELVVWPTLPQTRNLQPNSPYWTTQFNWLCNVYWKEKFAFDRFCWLMHQSNAPE